MRDVLQAVERALGARRGEPRLEPGHGSTAPVDTRAEAPDEALVRGELRHGLQMELGLLAGEEQPVQPIEVLRHARRARLPQALVAGVVEDGVARLQTDEGGHRLAQRCFEPQRRRRLRDEGTVQRDDLIHREEAPSRHDDQHEDDHRDGQEDARREPHADRTFLAYG